MIKKKETLKEVIGLRISSDHLSKLQKVADDYSKQMDLEITISDVVRTAIEGFLEQKKTIN